MRKDKNTHPMDFEHTQEDDPFLIAALGAYIKAAGRHQGEIQPDGSRIVEGSIATPNMAEKDDES